MARLATFGIIALVCAACGGESDPGTQTELEDPGPSSSGTPDAPDGVDAAPEDDLPAAEDPGPGAELPEPDTQETPTCTSPGCLGDLCDENADCKSDLCVWNVGDQVCTELCITECPEGWSCEQVGGGGSDSVFACLSKFPTLCYPCEADDDCGTGLGVNTTCTGYPGEGSFCASACDDGACPAGYACTDGACIAESGACGCSETAVSLGASTQCEASNDLGTCLGKRVCSEAGLSDCDASTPAEDLCDGIDNDCDGAVDTVACDDGDPCTVDVCAGEGGCEHTPAEGALCDDEEVCTESDMCTAGACVGTPVVCDDADPCTADTCVDGVGCLGVETGACECTADVDCPQPTDKCVGIRTCETTEAKPFPHCVLDPESAVSCPAPEGPNAPCNQNLCEPSTGECVTEPSNEGGACELGNDCTFADTCAAGECSAGPPIACEDDNLCTTDSCVEGVGCQHVANAELCDDSDACTQADTCAGGQCKGVVVACDDGDPCTTDSCDVTAGCINAPLAIGCDDGNLCTDDECVAKVGCVFTPNAAPCDDGDACTEVDTCVGGQCKGLIISCDDGDPCTSDSCDPATGCQHAPLLIGCDDGNGCTDDECVAKVGCVFTPNTAGCDDSDACTSPDTCAGGQCKGVIISCDDGDPCTTDSCAPATGCQHAPLAIGCDDGNGCTDDECVATVGCVFTPNAAGCDDGDDCTEADACAAGQCKGLIIDCDDGDPCTADSCAAGVGCKSTATNLGCSDGNPCTDDACEKGVGCTFAPNTEPCDDGSACTTDDLCGAGVCAGAPVACNDGDPCTTDSCAPASGCVTVAASGAPCEDGNACTVGDVCDAGACQGGGQPLCADGDPCTEDGCDPTLGCTFTVKLDCCGNEIVEEGEVCDDGGQAGGDGCSADCTSDEKCGNGLLDPGEACDGPSFPNECLKGVFACNDDCDQVDTSGCESWCGDGVLDPVNEACDGGAFVATCWDGAFACDETCQIWNKSGCNGWCGDGIANGPEGCDGADLSKIACPVGACSCSSDCTVKWEAIAEEAEWQAGTLTGTGTQPEVPLHPDCADPNTLCLDASTANLGHVWIANSANNEIAKINVDTGEVELEFNSGGTNPSRTAVAADGTVWVGNRGDTGNTGNGCNYNFTCSNIVHFDTDGTMICRGDVPGVVRAVTLDKDGNVWAGSWADKKMYKLSGTELDDTQTPPRCKIEAVVDVVGRAYGAAGDAKGNVWVAYNDNWQSNFDPAGQSIQQIDAATAEVVGTFVPPPSLNGCYQNYGIAVDGEGRVLIGSYRCFGVFRFTPGPNTWEWRHIPEGTPRGMAVDAAGNIYTALSCLTMDCWSSGNGRHIARIAPDFASHQVIDLGPEISHPVGASIDHNGWLWTAGRKSNSAARLEIAKWDDSPGIDHYPTNGSDPYTYSDMSGFQFLMFTNPEGTWSQVFDSGGGTVVWEVVEWEGIVQPGVTQIAVRARSAPNQGWLELAEWTDVVLTSPLDLSVLSGHYRYLEVEATLKALEGDTTPVLKNLTVHWVKP